MDSSGDSEDVENVDVDSKGPQDDAGDDNAKIDTARAWTNGDSDERDEENTKPDTPIRPTTKPQPNDFGIREEVLKATVYDIVPTIAAPHSTSINGLTATPDLRWVFTGGSDGYVRKFNWIETVNGKMMLTVAQRHSFVDSITKAGVLVNYWESGDEQGDIGGDTTSSSPVFSLACQRQALWLLCGLGTGAITLQSARYDEGKLISLLRGHKSTVSCLSLAPDERSFLSGSWDKIVYDWDLENGRTTRAFAGSGGQISALELRPASNKKINLATADDTTRVEPPSEDQARIADQQNAPLSNTAPLTNGIEPVMDIDGMNAPISPVDSLFGGSFFGDQDTLNTNKDLFNDTESMRDRPVSPAVNDARPVAEGKEGLEENCVEGSACATDERHAESNTTAGSSFEDMDRVSGEQRNSSDASPADPPVLVNGTSQKPPHDDATSLKPNGITDDQKQISQGSTDLSLPGQDSSEEMPTAGDVFLATSIDGSIRVWDKRQPNAVAHMAPCNVPPWCMNACWSPDGNFIYAGRRNGTVDEYDMTRGLNSPSRNFKLPAGSGPVSAVKALPNKRHLVCASYDILRLYDLQQQQIFKHATVPFLIIPGHRSSVVSQFHVDPSCRYLLTSGGHRGWHGTTSEVMLGYEINVPS